MKLIDVAKDFSTEDACLAYLEKMRWPSGLACLKCGSVRVSAIATKDKRSKTRRIYQCLEQECRHQFTATTGTIFHDTHLPLQKWFLAIALICEAKKGISANQLKRHLGIQYRTAWHLAHRIRSAMLDGTNPLTGKVEVDETYIGAKVPRRHGPRKSRKEKDVVIGMVERGGKLRFVIAANAKRASLQPILEANISRAVQTIYTDEHPIYPWALMQEFKGKHKTICHKASYGIGDTHTNTVENAFSLLKRGLIGTFHKVSIKHLSRYLHEFEFRFNRRDEQEMLFLETLRNLLCGKKLAYKTLTAEA
ncbi:MAG: IS1595 family transposase [Acidobacteria bacterium]|nr:IS1595 family transposase [Acidobacteriota bacterium]